MSANDKQVGGGHYKLEGKGEEHWDRVWRMHGRGYFVGCITKYVERYHLKNGVQDLEKAKHFLEKLIELESAIKKSKEDDPTPVALIHVPPGETLESFIARKQERDAWYMDMQNAIRPKVENIIADGIFSDGTANCKCLKCGMVARGNLESIRRTHECQAKG